MTYEYECPSGHLTDVVRSMRDVLPKTVKCLCGKRAKRIVSNAYIVSDGAGKHRTVDSAVRAYGEGHAALMSEQRKTTEWLTAIGAADGHKGDGKSAAFLPTAEGVRQKKELLKAGFKPPESVTFGLKSEFVQGIGK